MTLMSAAIADVNGCWPRWLRPIPDPAQQAEGALAKGSASEQGCADHREHYHHFDDSAAERARTKPCPAITYSARSYDST